MSLIEPHFLDARGELSEIRDWIRDCLTVTHEKASALMPLGALDVVVQAGRRVIPEKGHLGYAPKPGVIFITVDPTSPAMLANADASLERMFAHELHHAARWDGPGYGFSLGEALVSEGIAGHFVQELFGGSQEPWERLPITQIRPHVPQALREWDQTNYNHAAWFFGTGDLPRWLGYSLGFRLVERYLNDNPECRASKMSRISARDFPSTLSLI